MDGITQNLLCCCCKKQLAAEQLATCCILCEESRVAISRGLCLGKQLNLAAVRRCAALHDCKGNRSEGSNDIRFQRTVYVVADKCSRVICLPLYLVLWQHCFQGSYARPAAFFKSFTVNFSCSFRATSPHSSPLIHQIEFLFFLLP